MIVVIPYKNNPLDLAVLLTQLQQQTVKPKGIYIADNSEDGMALKIAKRYQFGTLIHVQLKVGPIHKSWNTGIKFANDDDVAIINDDIMVPENFIEVMTKFTKSGRAEMYCPANPGFPPSPSVRRGYEWKSTGKLEFYFLDKQQYVLPPSIAGWCMVIPHHAVEEIGLFDEGFKLYFGDKDYEARIFKAGGRVCFIKGLFVNHFGSSSTIKMDRKEHSDVYAYDEARFKKKWGIK